MRNLRPPRNPALYFSAPACAESDAADQEIPGAGISALMQPPSAKLLHDHPTGEFTRLAGIYLLLAAFNVLVWIWALSVFTGRPTLLGTALLAYVFGLRHAVDADHLAAIDNVVRKLMQEKKRPLSVGLFFSLGHSTVVVLATIAIAASAATLQDRFEQLRDTGGPIGTGVSAAFLLLIAIVNVVILGNVWATFRRVRRGERVEDEHLDMLLAGRGLLARLFRPLFRMIDKSWHMYPLGSPITLD